MQALAWHSRDAWWTKLALPPLKVASISAENTELLFVPELVFPGNDIKKRQHKQQQQTIYFRQKEKILQ